MKRLPSSQVPAVYRRNVGNVAVATVNDGMIPTAFDHIVGADPAACEAAHRSAGRPTPPWLTVNTYLIESGEHLMLVDAGFADNSPGAGRLVPNLAALGVKPIDIDTVLMTHLHADHDAGLIDRRGAAIFPSGRACRPRGRAEVLERREQPCFAERRSEIGFCSRNPCPRGLR
jgi:glyoxylase-like metal-dependent hydrolase (beta-lactamase superfamily II)